MTTLHHIRPLTLALASICVFALASVPSLADRSAKKQGQVRSAVSSGELSPVGGAVSATFRALYAERQNSVAKTTSKISAGVDTNRKDSRIVFARATPDVFTVKVELASDEASLDLGIYNMLGKRVMDVFKGPSSRGPHEYTQPISDLPEGVYICIAQGSDFRRAEKFYLSR